MSKQDNAGASEKAVKAKQQREALNMALKQLHNTASFDIRSILEQHQILCHPAVLQLSIPTMSRSQFEPLLRSVSKSGLRSKLVRDQQGRLVDGQARCAALLLLGKKPAEADWRTIDIATPEAAAKFIIRVNITRGHLTIGQRALVVAQQILSGSIKLEMLQDFKSFGTSKESVERAKRVLKSENEEVIDQVRSGKLSVSAADKKISGRVPDVDQPEDEEDSMPTLSRVKKKVSGGPGTTEASDANGDFDEEEAPAKPKKVGRPPGNATVNAWNQGWKLLLGTKSKLDDVRKLWRPTAAELNKIESFVSTITATLKKVKVKPKQ